MKRTYQPSNIKRNRKFGFLKRMSTKNGQAILKRRRLKGRKRLSAAGHYPETGRKNGSPGPDHRMPHYQGKRWTGNKLQEQTPFTGGKKIGGENLPGSCKGKKGGREAPG